MWPPVEQDQRDVELRRALAAFYAETWAIARRLNDPLPLLAAVERRLWTHARDLQDPTWWQRLARPDESET